MRGRKSTISILLFPDKRKRPRKVDVEAMVHGPLAYHRGVLRTGELIDTYVVTHVGTGLFVADKLANAGKARELVNRLLDAGIRWEFTDPSRMSRPDMLRAKQIVGAK